MISSPSASAAGAEAASRFAARRNWGTPWMTLKTDADRFREKDQASTENQYNNPAPPEAGSAATSCENAGMI